MGRSMRKLFNPELTPSKALEKYATFPRRRKEKSADNLHDINKDSNPNKATVKRQSLTPRSLPRYPRKKSIPKTKIYHEVGMQTALTQRDIEKAFSGVAVNPAQPQDVETCDKHVQVDRNIEELDKLQEQQLSEQASLSLTENLSSSFTSKMTSVTEMCPPVSLVDQVIEVDNLITKLLKVLRIIQIENEMSYIR
ncbi:hypothetical protein RN001_012063 [Aquatica leii]|uniref:Uncharacterized protein n=1 Tax=Aquatica leii TaxID=1421715 RepID=A0AAN7S7M2_9COLE|nr:hypothetical protein RN001_012063 [Aquatica leii]